MDDITEKQIQVSARLALSEKLALIELARRKGVDGITGLLKMLAKAKEVRVTL